MEIVAPPRGWRWLYRATGKRLPERYAAWVAHDIGRDGWQERQVLGALAVAALTWLPLALVADERLVPLLAVVGFVVGPLTKEWSPNARAVAYAHQKVHPDGTPWPDAPRVWGLHESLRPTSGQWLAFAVATAAIVAAAVVYVAGTDEDGDSEGFSSSREACIAERDVEVRVRSALRDDLGLQDLDRLAAVREGRATFVLVVVQGFRGVLRLDGERTEVVLDTSPSMFDPLPRAAGGDVRMVGGLLDCR